MSLRQAYRDLLLFSLFVGLIFSCILSIVYFIIYREMRFLVLGFGLGVLGTLEGIARFVTLVEFWRAIWDSWHKRREKRNGSEEASYNNS